MELGFKLSPWAWYRPENRIRALLVGLALIAAIGTTDYFVIPPFGFGNLYFFPIIMAAGFLVPWQILLMAVICMFLREMFGFSDRAWADALPRMFLRFSGYAGTALFVREVVVNRQKVVDSLARVQEQVLLRKDAEEQLQVLVESSPAAIVIVDSVGKVVDANQAADRLL